jgi:hypothetical protein
MYLHSSPTKLWPFWNTDIPSGNPGPEAVALVQPCLKTEESSYMKTLPQGACLKTKEPAQVPTYIETLSQRKAVLDLASEELQRPVLKTLCSLLGKDRPKQGRLVTETFFLNLRQAS